MENIFNLKFNKLNRLKETIAQLEIMNNSCVNFEEILDYINLKIIIIRKDETKKEAYKIKYYPENILLLEQINDKKYIKRNNNFLQFPLYYDNTFIESIIVKNKKYEIIVDIKLCNEAQFILEVA